jgi:hypothetical protein
MRLSKSTIVGRGWIENGSERLGRYDVGGARDKAHYTDIAVVAEEIEVIGGDIVAIIHVNLRPSPPRLLFIPPL